jgi:hypothetical protein
MAPLKPSPRFREWLEDAISRSGLSKREIARRIATKHPDGPTHAATETYRRTLNKILAGDLTPTNPTRAVIAEALGEGDFPSVEDDEEDELERALAAIAERKQRLASKRGRAFA